MADESAHDEVKRLRKALTLIDTRLALLARSSGPGTTLHAAVAMRDMIASALTEPPSQTPSQHSDKE